MVHQRKSTTFRMDRLLSLSALVRTDGLKPHYPLNCRKRFVNVGCLNRERIDKWQMSGQ